jgi:hypothetical protein
MKKLRYLAIAALALLPFVALKSYALGGLGGSAFPLTYITQPPLTLTDAFNQLLLIINTQTAGISTTYAGAITEPSAGVDTSNTVFSTNLQGNPLVLNTFEDVPVATMLSSATEATILASQTNRQIFPGGGLTIMVSGTAATATALALECEPSHVVVAQWPIAELVTNVPVGIYASSATVLGSTLTRGCAVSNALMLSNVGTTITTTTHVYVNLPYTVQ